MVRRRIRITMAAVAAAAVAATGIPAVGASAAPAPGSPLAAPPHAETVRLITGDVVHFTETASKAGPRYRATVVAAPRPGGAKVSFAQWSRGKGFYVVPSDMLPLLADRLDTRLFDVAGLAHSGLNRRATTPVIVQFDASAARTDQALAASAGRMAGAAKVKVKRSLTSVRAVSTTVEPGKASGLLAQLPVVGRGARTGSNGVSRIWLDGRVRATDTVSMPQIGAPRAWAAGYDGTGQVVAVLDTGIDSSHPDLVGQVSASQNFSTSADSGDHVGHGTHVASIIAGTGAASGGDLKGVAYGAKLLNVKVLGDDGYGDDSAVIDGMEWAASHGGTVVNMSLGSTSGDGTDPVSQAVNRISEDTGALFVISAGNSGFFGRGSVEAPGTADLALTVAAVDADDAVADFSSAGPRAGDAALKPDIAAPGVEILAARAADAVFGEPGDDYVALSGTSMAAPHVAGAAALLREARDDLTGQDVKSVLMGAAHDGPGDVWHEGTGRLDIPAAISQPVVAEPASVSFNVFRHPQTDLPPVTKDIVYRNPGNAAVTLSLAASVTGAEGAAAGGVTLSDSTLVVPAGGKASVEVTVDPAANPIGLYAGAVVATPRGGHAVRTTIGWEVEGPKFDVTLRAIDRAGAPGSMFGGAMNLAASGFGTDIVGEGETTLRLDPGTYFFGAFVASLDPESTEEATLAIADEVKVSADRTVTLDARKGVAASVRTPRPSKVATESDSLDRTNIAGDSIQSFWLLGERPFVTPTKRATLGTLGFSELFVRTGSTYDYFLGRITDGHVPAARGYVANPSRLATVTARLRAFTAGQQSGFGWSMWNPETGSGSGVAMPVRTPSTRTTYLSTAGVHWSEIGYMGVTPDGWPGAIYDGPERTLAPRQRAAIEVFTQVASPAADRGYAATDGESLYAVLPINSDSQNRPSYDLGTETTSGLRLYGGGRLLGENTTFPELLAPLPAGLRSVRLVQETKRVAPWWPLSTTMNAEWTVPLTGDDPAASLPLLDVRYAVAHLGGFNDVKAGKVSIGLGVVRTAPDGAARPISPATLRLQWSADGGVRWHSATVTRKRGSATATFAVPRGTKAISLRATARDGRGSAVTETVIDAIRVR